jgi:hypothetical protein
VSIRNGRKLDGSLHAFDPAIIQSLSRRVDSIVGHLERLARTAISAL